LSKKPLEIFNIPANYHFCYSLYDFINKNHQNISNLTILLPSKRACRELKKIIASNHKIIALPRIKAIADIDYDDFNFLFSNESHLEIQNAIDSITEYKVLCGIDELLYLSSQIQKTEIFAIKNNFSQSLKIADNLRQLFLEIEREGIELHNFNNVDDSNLSKHRLITFEFLKNFYSLIKNTLVKEKIIFESSYQNHKLAQFIKLLENNEIAHPLIIAGSTGSSFIGKKLIKAIAKNNQTQIILSGFTNEITTHQTHPQFLLSQLIEYLEIEKNNIKNIESPQYLLSNQSRIKSIKQIFLPFDQIHQWQEPNIVNNDHDLSQNFYVCELESNFSEARIIAKIVENELGNQQKIAIISADSQISDLIKFELTLRNIKFNDSDAKKISQNQIINFLISIIDFCCLEFNSHSFLALIKNSLCHYHQQQDLIKKFELEILRQDRIDEGLDGILHKLENADDDLKIFFNAIYSDFDIFLQSQHDNFATQISCLIKTTEKLSNKKWLGLLANQECALEIFEFIENLKQKSEFTCSFSELANVFKNLASHISYFKKSDPDLSIQIISPIEARLLNFDLVIIPALNEGIFPKFESENWLGRKIRRDLNIDNELKKAGQNANDFCHYLANKKVILTRHLSSDDVAAMPSPFWLRFNLYCQKFNVKINQYQFKPADQEFFSTSQTQDKSKNKEPSKEVLSNIPQISITDLVKLSKNPYTIFAKKILGLKELKDIDYRPSFAEFGSFVHQALEEFVSNNFGHSNIDDFLSRAKEIYQQFFLRAEDELLWWSKFPKILENFIVDNEDFVGFKNFLEVAVEMELIGQKIVGKIDRIIIDDDNKLQIIDYKTGTIPSKKDVENSIESQLTIAALILLEGIAKCDLPKISLEQIKSLKYWKVSTNLDDKNIKIMVDDKNMTEILQNTKEQYLQLIDYYLVKKNEFIAKSKDHLECYKHLARIY